MTVCKKEYRKKFDFDGLTVTVHKVYDYHGQFIGFGGRIGRGIGLGIPTIWIGNTWTGHKTNLRNGARMLLREYLEFNRRIKGV